MSAWAQTGNAARWDAVARLPRGERERAEAWTALEEALDLVASTPADWDRVPADLQEGWGFVVEDLARDVPTLVEATPERFRALMAERGYSQGIVGASDAIRDAFVHTVAARTALDAARWLAGPDAAADEVTRERIAALARAHDGAMPPWLAEHLHNLAHAS